MGCSSCGQRYRGTRRTRPTASAAAPPRTAPVRKRIWVQKPMRVLEPDTSSSSGTIAPDPKAGVVVPVPTDDIEPASGVSRAIITSDKVPDTFSDTLAKAVTVVDRPQGG